VTFGHASKSGGPRTVRTMIDDAKLIWFKPSSELTCAARSIRHAR